MDAKGDQHRCEDDRTVACPRCVHRKLRLLEPGDHFELLAGRYDAPVTADGLRGSEHRQIVISARTPLEPRGFDHAVDQPEPQECIESVFTSGIKASDFRKVANKLALSKQRSGEYPGLYYVADEAALLLRNCQHVTVEGLYFTECWPTAIYLDSCQDITIRDCQFRWGTFAIGATGVDTRHILVSGCRWRQFPENVGLWKNVGWNEIHGTVNPATGEGWVSVEADSRHLDGDFFCAWRIAGFVTIRDCVIEDAFNAIHMFAENGATFADRLNLNVVIENNVFRRIRDNAIEPEIGAWNWVVRHNVLIDVYRWFSFEMERSGWFYIYGNVAWHTGFPGQPWEEKFAGSVFKFSVTPHRADGPHYVFHNSWHLREPFAAKGQFSGLHVFNNAASFCEDTKIDAKCSAQGPALFAKKIAHILELRPDGCGIVKGRADGRTFTRAWEELDIAFHHNVFAIGPGVDIHREAGFPLGSGSIHSRPDIDEIAPRSIAEFRPKGERNNLAGKACGFTLDLHFNEAFRVEPGGDIGAVGRDGSRFAMRCAFPWEVADAMGGSQSRDRN